MQVDRFYNLSTMIMKSEDQLHSTCYIWFHNTYPDLRGRLWHTPNGGGRTKIEAVKFKSLGVRAGVHDLLFLYNGILYGFEFKHGKNHLSDEQIQFGRIITENGGKWWEIRDFEDFKQILISIIN